MAPTWSVPEQTEVARAVAIIRNAILEARVQLAVSSPLLSRVKPEEVRALRVALLDCDTALLRIKAKLRRVTS